MNNGKRSYFSYNKNTSSIPKSDVQESEVELEIKELNLEGDLSGDISGKTEISSSDIKTTADNSNDSSSDTSDTNEVSDSNDFKDAHDTSSEDENSDNLSDDTSSSEGNSGNSFDDMEDISDDNQGHDSKQGKKENETLKDKVDNLKEKANEIKNAPENIKNKVNEVKDKVNDAKDKVKEAPEKIRQKADKAKESWDNRPKSMKDVKDRLKNSDLKDKLKNGVKNQAKKAADRAKEGAKDAFENSNLGQGIKKAKNTIDNTKKAINNTKKAAKGAAKVGKAVAKGAAKAAQGLAHLFISTFPWSLIVVLVAAIVACIIIAVVSIAPGSNDNVNDGTSSYTKADQKTLEKMRKFFNKYPNADGTLAMAVVLYPYYDILHGTEVRNYLELGTDETPVDVEDDTIIDDENESDSEDIEDEDSEEDEDNDIYLEPFRKYTVRNKLKNILKKLNNSTEEEFEDYLINEYFKKDKGYLSYDGSAFNGYKELFDSVPSDKHDVLAEAIIVDLYDIKEVFINYVFTPQVCSSSSTSLGYSDGTDLIKGRAVVVLKDTASSSFSEIKAADASYGTDDYHLDLKRYVMGVAYAEVGEWVFNEEYAKVAMITAKSHLLGRNSNSGTGMGYKPDYVGDMTVFYTRNNTYDQGFCDIYEGCNSGSRYDHALINNDPTGEMWGNVKGALPSDKIALLEQWYDETAGEFIYDTKKEGYYSAYLNNSYDTYCPQGACLLQVQAHQDALNGSGYEAILKKYYSNDEFVIKNIETNTLSAVAVNCTSVLNGGCTIPEKEFVYYSQRKYSENFCGRTDGTISSSGCGITAMAMVIANLTDNKLTPVDTMNEAYQGGHCGAGIYGTNASYFSDAASKYGLTYESIPSSDTSLDADKKIKDTLNSGGLIIANVAGSQTAGSGKAWSTVSSGHYLVIKGITADEKLIIADPMTTALNNPWKNNLTIEEMRSYMNGRSFYLFTGGKSSEIKDKYCSSKGAGYLGNPLNPNDSTSSFMSSGNASCFPNYCGSGSPHGAVDIALDEGTPIYAMDSGTVEVSIWHPSWGNYVLINHGNGYKTLYAHFSELGVSKGQQVTKGQLIGKSGNTGNSTGPHLHIELQNIALYNANGRSAAKSSDSKGLMNPAKYINSNVSYVGQSN